MIEKKIKRNALIIISGLIAGLLGLWVLGKIGQPWMKKACVSLLETDDKRQQLGESRVAVIEAIRTKLGTASRRIVTVGKLDANKSVMIRSEIAGKIKEIPFKEGEDIQKGEVLFQFEDSDLIAELNQAEAQLAKAESDLDRSTQLRLGGKNIESTKKFDEYTAERNVAKARVEAAQAKLDKAKILAPFDGTIGLTEFSEGAFVQGAQDLVMLVDNSVLLIDFKVPESYLSDIGPGQTAEVRLDGFPNKVFNGLVEAIDSRVDPQSHSIAVRASLPNQDRKLRSGLFANVSLIIGEKANSIMVPEASVQREGEVEYVWIVQGGKADRRRVVTNTREKAQIEVIAGLRPDEIVVTSGQIKLVPGIRTRITNMPELYEDEEKGLSEEQKKPQDTEKETKKEEVTSETKAEVNPEENQPQSKESKVEKSETEAAVMPVEEETGADQKPDEGRVNQEERPEGDR